MEIVEKKLSELVPYENNPKHHPDEQIDKIAKSITEFGFKVPLVIGEDNEIVAGHGRLRAAEKLKLETVPCIIADDLTKEQIRAFRIADNRIQESGWDYGALKEELEDLEDFELELTGFEPEELEEIILGENLEEDTEEDNFTLENLESEDKTLIKKGDLVKIGEHRLFCGDSTNEKDLKVLMKKRKADMVFTDPPYNVDYEGGTGLKIKNDKMENNEFYNFLFKFYKNAFNSTKKGGAIYVCHADSEGLNFRAAFENAGWLMKQTLIWIKSSLVLGRQDYQWRHEPILYGWKPGGAHTWNNDRKQTTVIEPELGIKILSKQENFQITADTASGEVVLEVPSYKIINNNDDSIQTTWYFNKPSRNAEHPTMKPVKLVARAIKNSSRQNELILDPFAGSGSTLIAAEQLDRTCYMMELDEHYCDVIVRRYIDYKKNKEEEFSIKINGNDVSEDVFRE